MLQKTHILFVYLLVVLGCSNCSDDSITLTDAYQQPPEADTVIQIQVDTVYVSIQIPRSLSEHYVDTLKSYLGAREINGSNRGPQIDLFFNECGDPPMDPGNPYCACFANYGLVSIGLQGPKCAAWSPCWFPKDKVVWKRDIDPNHITFQPGWTFGLYFNRLKRVAHVGVVVYDFGDGYVLTIEGNTNSAGSREGNGVFMRLRHKDEIHVCSNWL
jgi:hypothetical protein